MTSAVNTKCQQASQHALRRPLARVVTPCRGVSDPQDFSGSDGVLIMLLLVSHWFLALWTRGWFLLSFVLLVAVFSFTAHHVQDVQCATMTNSGTPQLITPTKHSSFTHYVHVFSEKASVLRNPSYKITYFVIDTSIRNSFNPFTLTKIWTLFTFAFSWRCPALHLLPTASTTFLLSLPCFISSSPFVFSSVQPITFSTILLSSSCPPSSSALLSPFQDMFFFLSLSLFPSSFLPQLSSTLLFQLSYSPLSG